MFVYYVFRKELLAFFNKKNRTKMHVQKLPTGIEGFDDICHGGLPNARSTLVSGTSGTGKTVFSL